MEEKEIGKVSHYYDKIGVAIIDLISPLNKGDLLVIKANEGEVKQAVDSMQIDHKQVESAKKGDSVGVKVGSAVKSGSKVFKA